MQVLDPHGQAKLLLCTGVASNRLRPWRVSSYSWVLLWRCGVEAISGTGTPKLFWQRLRQEAKIAGGVRTHGQKCA